MLYYLLHAEIKDARRRLLAVMLTLFVCLQVLCLSAAKSVGQTTDKLQARLSADAIVIPKTFAEKGGKGTRDLSLHRPLLDMLEDSPYFVLAKMQCKSSALRTLIRSDRPDVKWVEDYFECIGYQHPSDAEEFRGSEFVLTAGRLPTEEELNSGAKVVICSQTFAKANGLQVGSRVPLTYSHATVETVEKDGQFYYGNMIESTCTVELELIGTVEDDPGEAVEYYYGSFMPVNRLYVPFGVIAEAARVNSDDLTQRMGRRQGIFEGVLKISFHISEAQLWERIDDLKEKRGKETVKESTFNEFNDADGVNKPYITVNGLVEEFLTDANISSTIGLQSRVSEPLHRLAQVLKLAAWAIGIIWAFVMILAVLLGERQRLYDSKVLRCLGMGNKQLATQQLLGMGATGLVSFVAGSLLAGVLSLLLNGQLQKQALNLALEMQNNLEGVNTTWKTLTQVQGSEIFYSLSLAPDIAVLSVVLGLSAAVCLLGAALSLVPVLRQAPMIQQQGG